MTQLRILLQLMKLSKVNLVMKLPILVEGVTKISVFENTAGGNSKVENFRKLILATSKDIRVLLVKIADRLHNMRTIKAITKEEKRLRIAQETMEIYAPLADRNGNAQNKR